MKYLEKLRVAWLIYWRGLILVAVLSVLSGMFTLGIVGVMSIAGIPDSAIRNVVPLVVIVAIPAALLPFIVRMAMYKEYRGFEMKVARSEDDLDEDLRYWESAKVAWLLGWRVLVGLVVFYVFALSILLFQAADVVVDDPGNASQTAVPFYLVLATHALIIFGLLPLGLHSMLRKRFRGFTVAVNRENDLSFRQITGQTRSS